MKQLVYYKGNKKISKTILIKMLGKSEVDSMVSSVLSKYERYGDVKGQFSNNVTIELQ